MCVVNGVKRRWKCCRERDVVTDVMYSKFEESPEGKGCAEAFCCVVEFGVKELV